MFTGKNIFILTSAILIFLHVSVWIQDNHAFSVREIRIAGASLVTDEEVLAAAKIDISSPIMEANVETIRKRLLRGLPQVMDVRVSRIFPSTIRIELIERDPIAIILDNGIWGVDSDGVLLPRFSARHGLDYPVITNIRLQKYVPGEKVDDTGLTSLVRFLGELRTLNPALYSRISEVTIDDMIGVRLIMLDYNVPVLMGHERLLKKCKDLEIAWDFLLNSRKAASIKYLDLRYRDQIILKKKA